MLHRILASCALSMSVLVAASTPLLAVDGVIEINQASIEAAGGFPFVINSGFKSYRLTSNLNLAGTAIELHNAPFTTIDLNGFGLFGTTNIGTGINGSDNSPFLSVKNGSVSNFNFGIVGGPGTVEDVRVVGNAVFGVALSGFQADGASLVSRVTAHGNGTGIKLQKGLITDCVVSNNAIGVDGTPQPGAPSTLVAFKGCVLTGNTANAVTINQIGENRCDAVACP